MPKSGLGASNCNQWWDQVGQVHINMYINKTYELGENLGPSIDILSLTSVQSLPFLRRGWFCPCQSSLCGWADRCVFWGSSGRLLPPDLERQTSAKPSYCIAFIPGINCLNSVTITSGVFSVNHPVGEITSLYLHPFHHTVETLNVLWRDCVFVWGLSSPSMIIRWLIPTEGVLSCHNLRWDSQKSLGGGEHGKAGIRFSLMISVSFQFKLKFKFEIV